MFPAGAGVILVQNSINHLGRNVPRRRGGDPAKMLQRGAPVWMFPAGAGVIPFLSH